MKIELTHVQALRIAQLEASLAQANFTALLATTSFRYGKDLSTCNIQPDGTVVENGTVDGSSPNHVAGDNRDTSVEAV